VTRILKILEYIVNNKDTAEFLRVFADTLCTNVQRVPEPWIYGYEDLCCERCRKRKNDIVHGVYNHLMDLMYTYGYGLVLFTVVIYQCIGNENNGKV
jgi:hypothetical protein